MFEQNTAEGFFCEDIIVEHTSRLEYITNLLFTYNCLIAPVQSRKELKELITNLETVTHAVSFGKYLSKTVPHDVLSVGVRSQRLKFLCSTSGKREFDFCLGNTTLCEQISSTLIACTVSQVTKCESSLEFIVFLIPSD